MEWLFATTPSWAITVVRVVLGVIFFAHGAQKVLGWFGGYGLKGTTRFLTSIGLPLPVAYASASSSSSAVSASFSGSSRGWPPSR